MVWASSGLPVEVTSRSICLVTFKVKDELPKKCLMIRFFFLKPQQWTLKITEIPDFAAINLFSF